MTDHDKAILKIARLGKDLIQEGTDKEDEGLLRIIGTRQISLEASLARREPSTTYRTTGL